VINASEFTSNRGEDIIEVLTLIMRKCSPESLQKRKLRNTNRADGKTHDIIVERFIEPFVVRFNDFMGKSAIDKKFDDILEVFNEKKANYDKKR